MPKISKTNEDTFRKKLVEEERRKYLEGKGKSKSLQEVEQVALSNRQRKNAKFDQEIAIHLPLLNFRQKRVVLSLVKALAFKQARLWEQVYIEQRQTLKKSTASSETTVTSTKVPGMDMTQGEESDPKL